MGGGRTAVGWRTTHGAPSIGLTMGPGGGGARNLPSKKYPLDSLTPHVSPGTRRTGKGAALRRALGWYRPPVCWCVPAFQGLYLDSSV